MAQLLATLDDINTHLPEDKISADDSNTDLLQVEVARFIRAMLAGTFKATTLASWSSPGSTPDLIRSIAGRLIAAKYYGERYAEDNDISQYAMGLYNEAIGFINAIKTGNMVVVDINDNPVESSGLAISEDDFWPNSSAPAPKFSMDQVFG